jgi:hypothetical protein
MSAVFALKPALYTLRHRAKFASDPAIRAADDRVGPVLDHRVENRITRSATSGTTTLRLRFAGFRTVNLIDSVAKAIFTK